MGTQKQGELESWQNRRGSSHWHTISKSIIGDEPKLHISSSWTKITGFEKSACLFENRLNASVSASRVPVVFNVLRKLFRSAENFTTWFICSNIMHHVERKGPHLKMSI